MNYKYQLIILGTTSPIVENLKALFSQKIYDLNLPKDVIRFIDVNNFHSDYSGNQPAFVFYLGDKNGKFQDLSIIEALLKDGTMILPIYITDKSFSIEIPEILGNQNGIQYQVSEEDRIVNIALESFELLRSTRKIFISYRRAESSSVAIQMYEALESHNFDVFLDTHTISKAEPFQEELWHRMTDCDVILLLNTPKFLESHWCKEEFAEASAKQIGIVQLVWPNHLIKNIDSASYISYPIQLSEHNFINELYKDKDTSKLNEWTTVEIIQKIESVRARNLAARQDNLITEFRNIAARCGKNVVVQPEKFLTETMADGKRRIYIPTIGIPQSTSCQAAELKQEMLNNGISSIRLIYDDLRIRDKWLKHLDWLNDNFIKDIKTLKKQDFESWLKKN